MKCMRATCALRELQKKVSCVIHAGPTAMACALFAKRHPRRIAADSIAVARNAFRHISLMRKTKRCERRAMHMWRASLSSRRGQEMKLLCSS
eukprot:3718129-Karenia_brevis.AAC.1